MKILNWDKPKAGEHVDELTWRAKGLGGKNPRTEIRKTTEGRQSFMRGKLVRTGRAEVRMVVWPSGKVMVSMNGKAEFDMSELQGAIAEAHSALKEERLTSLQ